MEKITVKEIENIVSNIAPKYPVKYIELFGSYANDEVKEGSDIDLLVYFNEKSATLFDLIGIKLDIEDKLSIKVDIVAGPIKKGSYLIINKKIRIYEA